MSAGNTVSKPDTECGTVPKDNEIIDVSGDDDDHKDYRMEPDMPSGLDGVLDNATPDMVTPPGNATPLLSENDDESFTEEVSFTERAFSLELLKRGDPRPGEYWSQRGNGKARGVILLVTKLTEIKPGLYKVYFEQVRGNPKVTNNGGEPALLIAYFTDEFERMELCQEAFRLANNVWNRLHVPTDGKVGVFLDLLEESNIEYEYTGTTAVPSNQLDWCIDLVAGRTEQWPKQPEPKAELPTKASPKADTAEATDDAKPAAESDELQKAKETFENTIYSWVVDPKRKDTGLPLKHCRKVDGYLKQLDEGAWDIILELVKCEAYDEPIASTELKEAMEKLIKSILHKKSLFKTNWKHNRKIVAPMCCYDQVLSLTLVGKSYEDLENRFTFSVNGYVHLDLTEEEGRAIKTLNRYSPTFSFKKWSEQVWFSANESFLEAIEYIANNIAEIKKEYGEATDDAKPVAEPASGSSYDLEEKERKQRCQQEGMTRAIDEAWELTYAGTTRAYSPTYAPLPTPAYGPKSPATKPAEQANEKPEPAEPAAQPAFTTTVEDVPRFAMTAGKPQEELYAILKKDIATREAEAAKWREDNDLGWLPRKDVVVNMRMGTSFHTLEEKYGPETIKRALKEHVIHFDGDTLSLRLYSKSVKHGTLVQTVAHGTVVNYAPEQMIVYSPQGAHQVYANDRMDIVNKDGDVLPDLLGWQEARRAWAARKEEKVISTADDEKNETQPVIEEFVTTYIASSVPKGGKVFRHPAGVDVEVVSQDVIDLSDGSDDDAVPQPKRPREESVVAKPNKRAKTVGDERTDSDIEV